MAIDPEKELKETLAKEKRIKVLQEKIDKTRVLRKELETEFQSRSTIFLTTAFGVVAALFWQTAITDTIKAFIPISGAWFYELFVAIIVTIIAILAIFFISKIGKKNTN